MDVIEFLKRTDNRNLKYNIGFLVKEKLKEFELDLKRRRECLRLLLETENHQYDEELALLIQKRLEDEEAKRLEWIGQMRLERERAEEELRKLKKIQRDLENSEEIRHLRSREMLLDSKQSQLYQMEERKILNEKEKKLEKFWLQVMEKFNNEKKQQEIAEEKLRRIIDGQTQEENLRRDKEIQEKLFKEGESLKRELNEENMKAFNMERENKKEAEFFEWRKKLFQRDNLRHQIFENALEKATQIQMENEEANFERQKIQRDILLDLDQRGAEVVKNRFFSKEFLIYRNNERKLQEEQEKEFEEILKGKCCVLEQKNKTPYGKESR